MSIPAAAVIIITSRSRLAHAAYTAELEKSFSLAALPSGHLAHHHNAMGFEILTVRFSSHFEYDLPHEYTEQMEQLAAAARKLGADFAFLCGHGYQAEQEWLEREVLGAILAGQEAHLHRLPVRKVLVSPGEPGTGGV